MRDQKLFIDGAWVDGVDTFEVHDPFDQTLVGTVAVASAEQAAEAVTAAKAAMLAGWPAGRAGRPAAGDQPAGRRARGRLRRADPRRGRQADLRGPGRGVAAPSAPCGSRRRRPAGCRRRPCSSTRSPPG